MTHLLLFIVVVHTAGLLTVAKVLLQQRSEQSKTLWAVVLLLCPYLALPYYWALGSSRHGGFRQTRQSVLKEMGPLSEEIVELAKSHSVNTTTTHCSLQALTKLPITSGNTVDILVNGENFFPTLYEAMSGAQEYILAQFYLVREDSTGRQFAEQLKFAAARGVRVSFFYDPFESTLTDGFIQSLEEAGVNVAVHSPSNGLADPFEGNFRNHRKIVVIDGATAYVGGMNIGDEYRSKDPKLSPWRDTHFKIQGPAIMGIQVAFLRDFYHAKRALPTVSRENWEAGGETKIGVIPTSAADTWDGCGLAFLEAICMAKSRLWLTSPFLIPDEKGLAALELAALRGVDVKILIPKKTGVHLADLVTRHNVSRLIASGIQFYQNPAGAMHQKVTLVDHVGALVGSANYDYRSFHLNLEIQLWLEGNQIVEEIEKMLGGDFEDALHLTTEDMKQRSVWKKLQGELAAILQPFL